MSRPYHGRSDDHVGFILIILVAGAVWAHKSAIAQVEQLLLVIWITLAGIIGMTGLEFEKYVAELLKIQGYNFIRLTEYYDLGVDIIAEKNGIRWGVQVKRYSGLVKANAIRQVVTALSIYSCDRAIVVTNSTFSYAAKKLADSNRCLLVDRNDLLLWTDRS